MLRHYPCMTTVKDDMVSSTGAGDAFNSGFITAMLKHKSEAICVSVGFEAATASLHSMNAVPLEFFNESHPCWKTPAQYNIVKQWIFYKCSTTKYFFLCSTRSRVYKTCSSNESSCTIWCVSCYFYIPKHIILYTIHNVHTHCNCNKKLKRQKSIFIILKLTRVDMPSRNWLWLKCQCGGNKNKFIEIIQVRWNFYEVILNFVYLFVHELSLRLLITQLTNKLTPFTLSRKLH